VSANWLITPPEEEDQTRNHDWDAGESRERNCHPNKMAMMILSPATRFVHAISHTIAEVKFAPLRKTERVIATAAYEHDGDAAPNPHAFAMDLAESSGNIRVISDFERTA
jgi:hypothetical protein